MAPPEDPRLTSLLLTFYTTPRLGQEQLSDGGGPFGFDITTALQIDFLIDAYDCDGIVETGCHLGDTTEYLANRYPHLPVRTCDMAADHAAFTKQRLARHQNVNVLHGDSAALLPSLIHGLNRPLVYLDAHWQERWPLRDELRAIHDGVVAIDDFFIGHERFGYDHYNGELCGPGLVAQALPEADELFVGNPYGNYPVPCLQTGRRSGTGYLARDLDSVLMARSDYFVRVPLRPEIIMPPWEIYGPRRRKPAEVSA
ncbi:hypothetical protein M2271_007264 [Streptomyces sp. LBL]|uniref:hypothetical protein n=1 Tax=Streptomyces sp. LBL TaxID=2940562 RepID=UPI0024738438|nr:hypothetical protein [Streptomyces sp. LBL]MDH6629428.1 hypothetical protein [Streptomyces sp. LBL]